MKNLKYHQQQVKAARARNAIVQIIVGAARIDLEIISDRIREASNKRWDALLADFRRLCPPKAE